MIPEFNFGIVMAILPLFTGLGAYSKLRKNNSEKSDLQHTSIIFCVHVKLYIRNIQSKHKGEEDREKFGSLSTWSTTPHAE